MKQNYLSARRKGTRLTFKLIIFFLFKRLMGKKTSEYETTNGMEMWKYRNMEVCMHVPTIRRSSSRST